MMRILCLALLVVLPLAAQENNPNENETPQAPVGEAAPAIRVAGPSRISIANQSGDAAKTEPTEEERETENFREILNNRHAGQVDYARAMEEHLRLFPDTHRRAEIERTLVQLAMENRDNRRIIRYGESVLGRDPNRLDVMERLIRALLESDDAESSARALEYAQRYESSIKVLEMAQPPSGPARVKMRLQLDAALGKALAYQSRATGNLGDAKKATELARRSYEANPSAEAAREIGRWLAAQGKHEEAIPYIADAFVMNDQANSPQLRDGDRKRLKEFYLKSHDAEAGLGDIILDAYDRTGAELAKRHDALRKLDPNLDAREPLDFILPGLDGDRLEMKNLLGKVVVLDFWATWCQPCHVQQPLFEEVMGRYKDNPEVVFLNINTDEQREIVGEFLQRNGWKKIVYFEDGLQRVLDVPSIPTTVILDRFGDVASKMVGFNPADFVDTLSARIERTLATE